MSKLKYLLFVLNIQLIFFSFGQNQDRRSVLEIDGDVKEISVSPDEKIWLVSEYGEVYFANNIDSNWHYGNFSTRRNDKHGIINQYFLRISFFNKDTAILTGGIISNVEQEKSNGYYLTKNGGETWEIFDFEGDSYIYSSFTLESGHAWLGCNSKKLLYTCDFGKNWTEIEIPYELTDRTLGIYMNDSLNGIVASYNQIISTRNNWKTSKHLKTPYDQKKYGENNSYSNVRKRIFKIQYWGKYIVVNQDGSIFYSDAQKNRWRSFPIEIVDFEVDIQTKKLYAVTDSLEVITFQSPEVFRKISKQKLKSAPRHMKVVNQDLYLLSEEFNMYKVNEHITKHITPFTYDKQIPEPKIIKETKNVKWGITNNQLYLKDTISNYWYRENSFDFKVVQMKLLSDSVAILWDGLNTNYIYSLIDKSTKKYLPNFPITSFLDSPITELSILSKGNSYCTKEQSEILYLNNIDSNLETMKYDVVDYQNDTTFSFVNSVSSWKLANILKSIDENPLKIPNLKEFNVTQKDKNDYLMDVEDRLNGIENFYFEGKNIYRQFYYTIPFILDTLNSEIINEIIKQEETEKRMEKVNKMVIQLKNQKKEILEISKCFCNNQLIWEISYNGLKFNCYSVDLNRFIESCLPDNFLGKEFLQNKALIMEIADYLYEIQVD